MCIISMYIVFVCTFIIIEEIELLNERMLDVVWCIAKRSDDVVVRRHYREISFKLYRDKSFYPSDSVISWHVVVRHTVLVISTSIKLL